jgi:predicted RNA binding protein YcfA (HicA-like mRNA interferase family)
MVRPKCQGNPHGDNMKVRQVIKLIEADGWFRVRTKGDHRQFHHPKKRGTVTVAGKLSEDVPPGTLNSILRQAGLKGD